jgi:predicted GIY-YIG superfamily endonuclease
MKTEAEANNLEKQIKRWSRKKKETLISGHLDELKKLSNAKRNFNGPSSGSGPG